MSAAQFSEAEALLDQVQGLWVSAPGVAEQRRLLAKSQRQYHEALVIAKEAMTEGKLERALNYAKNALAACPSSAEAEELVNAIEQLLIQAQTLLHEVKTRLAAAQFDVARATLIKCQGLWSGEPECIPAAAEIEAVERAYHDALEEARASYDLGHFETALTACERAIWLCPQSDAATFKKCIEASRALRQKQLESRLSFRARMVAHHMAPKIGLFLKELGLTVWALVYMGGLLALALIVVVALGLVVTKVIFTVAGALAAIGVATVIIVLVVVGCGLAFLGMFRD